MTSNTRLSILKPGRPREPLQDLSQLIPNNEEEETTTTDNHKRRVSFAAVNKVKEFETGAECTTLHQTPAYDERFSTSSDSYQSSMSECSHNKSTFITSRDSSVTLNRSKVNDENIDIVEITHNMSKVAPSPGKMYAGDSSMDITSVIVREEYTDYESNSESYLPLNLTKSRQSTQSAGPEDSDDNKDILETSSMETTEALPCIMTETIMTDYETFNQSMDVSVEEIGVEEENGYRLSMNATTRPEKIIHLRKSTVLVSEKDVQLTVDTFGDVKNTHVRENIFVQKQVVNFPTVESSAMEEDTSLNIQNCIIDKENLMVSGNTCTEDGSDFQVEETEIVETEMDMSISKSIVPAKVTFCSVSNVFEVTEKDMQSAVSAIETQENILPGNTDLENKTVELAESIFAEEKNSHLEKPIEKEENLLLAKNVTIQMEKNSILAESVLEGEKHSHVENIVDENETHQAMETSIVEESDQLPPTQSPVAQEKGQSQPVQSPVTKEKEPFQSVQSPPKEKEQFELVQSPLAKEKDQSQLVQSPIASESAPLQSVLSPVVKEKEQFQPVQSPIAKEKEHLQPVQSPVAKETEQLQLVENLVTEHLEPVHNSVLLEPAENPATEESNFLHDEILSIELQNCQLIEDTRIEEEKSLHLDESKMKGKTCIGNAVDAEEEPLPSPKNVTLEETPIIANTLIVENSISEQEISHPAETSVIEMEELHPAKDFDKNDDMNVKSSENGTEDVISSRPLKRKSDSFVPEIPPPEPSPKRPNTEINLEIVQKNETIRNQIEKAIKRNEIPCWTVVSLDNTEWKFGTLWNRLHLIVTLSETDAQCTSKLRYIKKDSKIGDEILKVAIAPIIRKYRKKMDELCGRVEDVAIFMKMTLPSINFAQRFAEDFSEIIEFESISLDNGFASFLVTNYKSHLLAKIQVDMRNIEDFSDSSLKVIQNLGNLDDTLVRKIFFEARGGFDFFSKFVKNLNQKLNS